MRLLTLATLPAIAFALVSAGIVSAQTQPEFKLGFKALADQIPGVVGQPLENEHWGANGDSLQQTARGLMAWRKADNWTAFTDGSKTWINEPSGVQSRGNDERFDWEGSGPAAWVDGMATRSGPAARWSPPQGGSADGGFYGSAFWFTSGGMSLTTAQASVRWQLKNPAGSYRLYAHIPSHGALNGQAKRDASGAAYQWRNPGGQWQPLDKLDQEQYSDELAYLGKVTLGANAEVSLGDNVGALRDGEVWVLFSAILAIPE